jgi:hypothetical protein
VPEWMVYAHEAGHYLEGFIMKEEKAFIRSCEVTVC